jgi:hypothetical protein
MLKQSQPLPPLTVMKPKFATTIAWQQSELLMQPVYIRTIDNLRKVLEESSWKGDYQEYRIWAEDIPLEQRTQFALLQQEVRTAAPQDVEALEIALAELPAPFSGYNLILTQGTTEKSLDLWDLCYQVCFVDPDLTAEAPIVTVDTTLLDECGEVDWTALEAKTKQIVQQAFATIEEEA